MKNVEATILNMDIMTEFYRLYFTTNAKIKVNIVCVKYSLCRPYRDYYYCYMAIIPFIYFYSKNVHSHAYIFRRPVTFRTHSFLIIQCFRWKLFFTGSEIQHCMRFLTRLFKMTFFMTSSGCQHTTPAGAGALPTSSPRWCQLGAGHGEVSTLINVNCWCYPETRQHI